MKSYDSQFLECSKVFNTWVSAPVATISNSVGHVIFHAIKVLVKAIKRAQVCFQNLDHGWRLPWIDINRILKDSRQNKLTWVLSHDMIWVNVQSEDFCKDVVLCTGLVSISSDIGMGKETH